MTVSRRNFMIMTSLTGAAPLLPRGALGAVPTAPAQEDLSDWGTVRRLFRLDPQCVHLSPFGLASHPRPVRDAVEQCRQRLDENPLEAMENPPIKPDAAAAAIGRYMQVSPDDIALTSNTTSGLGMVYLGLPLRPGDEVLTSAHDHLVHHESIRIACERAGAKWRKVALFPPHQAAAVTAASLVAKLREAISPATRVLALTWVYSSCGLKMPLAQIAAAVQKINASRKADERILVVADSVHGFGAADPAELHAAIAAGVDVVISGLHKWVLAPRGTGFVWARPAVWARMRPALATFSAPELRSAWMEERAPQGPARASWFPLGGYHDFEHLWGIAAAFELHQRIGPARIAARIQALNHAVRSGLAAMKHVRLHTPQSDALACGINCFEVDGLKAGDVVQRLRANKLMITTSPYAVSYARISLGISNSESDVEKALAAVQALRGA